MWGCIVRTGVVLLDYLRFTKTTFITIMFLDPKSKVLPLPRFIDGTCITGNHTAVFCTDMSFIISEPWLTPVLSSFHCKMS